MSPTTGASTSQVQEELMLCQTWSKYCGLRKVVFPSGDVWIQPTNELEPTGGSSEWVLVGGDSIAPSKSRRSSSGPVGADNGAGGPNNPLEGEPFDHGFILSSSEPRNSRYRCFVFSSSGSAVGSTTTPVFLYKEPKNSSLGRPIPASLAIGARLAHSFAI